MRNWQWIKRKSLLRDMDLALSPLVVNIVGEQTELAHLLESLKSTTLCMAYKESAGLRESDTAHRAGCVWG